MTSLVGCDDIVVLDSGSIDRTVEIAREAGARVFVREFDTFAQQRNHAHREIQFRHPWVLHLDAVERLPVELRVECSGVTGSVGVDGFVAAPKMLWNGQWVRRSSRFPQPEVCFVRAAGFEFAEGPDRARAASHLRMDQLFSCLVHDASSGGEAERLKRHRPHAVAEAKRRLACPSWHYALPFRSLLCFVHRYLFCGGFLDGREGFGYCRQLARYEALASQELRRLRAAART
jgi:hypothetical protein